MADLADTLVAKYYRQANGVLRVGRHSVLDLASAYGTPFFLYDRAVLEEKYGALRTALPKRFSIYYSIKANPHAAILKHFLQLGCGLELASLGEYCRAREAGCLASRMVFAGPGKLEKELEHVLSEGIAEIHIESLTEARRISAISKKLGRCARVAIRINPTGEVEGGAMRMGGRPSPFGFDEETLDEVVEQVRALPAVEICGVHLYIGTQINEAATLLGQYQHGMVLARKVAALLNRPLHTLDFGGGFGVPYFAHEHELDLEALHAGLERLCEEADSDEFLKETQFIVEPGRFLTAEAGIFVTRVNDIKVSRGKEFVIVDGGMNHHLAASGNLGQTIKRNYPIALLNKLGAPPEQQVEIVGPLCTPLDTLARGILLPRPEIGDLVGIFQSGAYGKTASPAGFLSHPPPKEIFLDSERETELPASEKWLEPAESVD